MSYSGKKIFISGVAGFVPGHVARSLLEKGAHVVGLDNFVTGAESTVDELSKNPNFKFFRGDVVTDPLPEDNFDYVLSLASPASPIDFGRIPLEIMRTNSEGTRRLLELSQKVSATFLEASTSEVYGDPLEHPQKESYWGNVNTIGPRSCYDESKRFAEALTMTFHNHYGVDTRIVRIFNTYGPHMRPKDGRVIPNFINQALEGKDITCYGTGEQTRSFCYVNDLVDMMLLVLEKGDHNPYNIGNPGEYTINQLAKMVLEFTESSSKISYKELPVDDPTRRRPDISRIKALGAEPKVSLNEGLAKTIEYFRK